MGNLLQKVNNSFIKGLITEAGELTFPENASVDELNCELFRDGSRRRRKAIVVEEDAVNSTFSLNASQQVTEGSWDNVGNDASKTYLVLQVGRRLRFYNKGSFPYSAQEVAGSIDLLPYEAAGTVGAANTACQFASIQGALVVVSAAIEPIYIQEVDGVFEVTQINPRIRDFEWLSDTEEFTTPKALADVTIERQYDTSNSGWTGDPSSPDFSSSILAAYVSARAAYPPLTHPWYSGRNADGDFTVNSFEQVYGGTSILGNGRWVLDLFNKDRSAVSGVVGLPVVRESTRFTSVTSFSSRVFFSGLTSPENTGKIFYSQILQDLSGIGKFHQQQDPVSEYFSDLLDTDGGYINIPDAINVKKLFAFKNSLFIFAENGVWQVRGVDNVFKPTAYSISKVTEVGLAHHGSFISAEGVPFWWSRHGIHTLSFNEFGEASEENISVSTIQTFWNSIPVASKTTVKAEYDRVNKKILWLYSSRGETITNKFNEVLILDITLKAFYPWSFSNSIDNSYYVVGMAYYTGAGADEVVFDVVVDTDDVVVGSDNIVSTQESPLSTANIDVVFLVRDVTSNRLSMAVVNGGSFLDWGTSDFSSYAVTGYDFMESLTLDKTAPYIFFYMRETETGWEAIGDGSYTPVGESSMLVSAYWDFKKTPSSIPQQVYRRRQPIIVDETDLDTFTSPSTSVTTKIKVRGRGKSLRLRFESETGKDFIYLGHGLIGDASTRI